ncbi:HEPN domain-containing protein [Candidatus Magnetomonas plexicatena]|nr:HEPN domain-containing protein [Nitrospirales bacterium LBB_01]
MKNTLKAREWLKRAKSNLARARLGKVSDEILYEDICFDAQQAVEKALKAVCVINEINFNRAHDISYLIDLLDTANIKLPKRLHRAKLLTNYAVETRYPGDYMQIDKDMYEDALKIAEMVLKWVDDNLEKER